MIREYIKNQESEERREEATQLNMFEDPSGSKGAIEQLSFSPGHFEASNRVWIRD